jgi:hypothetical protein
MFDMATSTMFGMRGDRGRQRGDHRGVDGDVRRGRAEHGRRGPADRGGDLAVTR